MIGYSGWTHTGFVRKKNEDSFKIASLGKGSFLFMVADGIGGSAGGEIASGTAIDVVAKELNSTSIEDMKQCRKHMQEAVLAAHRAVIVKAGEDPDLAGMGTTLTAMVLCEMAAKVAHVGDSRLYHWHAGSLQQITQDHSLISEWLSDGKITEEEALLHPYRNMLTQAVGIDPLLETDYYELDMAPGDIVLICTDGLSNMVSDQQIAEIITTAADVQTLCEKLGEEALQNGGHDNITLIVVKAASEQEME